MSRLHETVRHSSLNIIIGGGSGLVGTRLSEQLRRLGHEVKILSRKTSRDPNTVYWNPDNGEIDRTAVRQADIIINLAGEGIADAPWTATRKKKIIESRTQSTALLAEALTEPGHRCKQYISASAVGFYGNQGDKWVKETDSAGQGFLSESCTEWENSVHKLQEKTQIPIAIVRVGIVMSTLGGALPKLKLPLYFFVSPTFGNGNMYYPWIHIEDLAGTFIHVVDQQLTGTFNACAPEPLTQRALMQACAKALGRWALPVPAPAFVLSTVLGEMSHTVLDSTRASSEKLVQSGFTFQHPLPIAALKDLIDRNL